MVTVAEEKRRQRMSDKIIAIINEAREAKGLSGRELSELSGVSMQHLYCVLRGEQNPTLSTIVAICRALDLEISLSSRTTTV